MRLPNLMLCMLNMALPVVYCSPSFPLSVHANTASSRLQGKRRLPQILTKPLDEQNEVLNAVVAQYIGVISENVLGKIREDVSSNLPSRNWSDSPSAPIQKAVLSMLVGTTDQERQAVESLSECLSEALAHDNRQYDCFRTPDDIVNALRTLLNGYIEQAVGYLTPNVVTALTNIIFYHTSSLAASAGLQPLFADLNNVIASLTATSTGNTVTAIMQLQQCILNAKWLQDEGGLVPKKCIDRSLMWYQQIMLSSIAQQGFGYLPPTLVLDLQRANTPESLKSSSTYKSVLERTFTASGLGPRFVDCFVTLESCMVTAYLEGQLTKCTTLQDACKGLQEGMPV